MNSNYTPGPWVYNEEKYQIESSSQWFVEPDEKYDQEGIRQAVISTRAAMSGNDTNADINLICSAPDMVLALQKIVDKCRKELEIWALCDLPDNELNNNTQLMGAIIETAMAALEKAGVKQAN
jgi:hypothetical protein